MQEDDSEEDGSEADVVMNYEGQVKFYFIEDKLDSIVFMNVDEDYFDRLFSDYSGFKFVYSRYVDHDNHYFYSKESARVLHASTGATDRNLNLSLYYPDTDLRENAEFLYMTQQKIKNQHPSSTKSNIDLAKPTFSEKDGYLYLHGVTLGDSPSKVIERLGENYIIGQADGSESEFLINYGDVASLGFYNDKLDSIVLIKVDKDYFDELFTQYEGLKIIENDYDRYIYSEETSQLIKATTQTPNNDLYLYIGYPGPEFWDHPEMQDIPNPWEQ